MDALAAEMHCADCRMPAALRRCSIMQLLSWSASSYSAAMDAKVSAREGAFKKRQLACERYQLPALAAGEVQARRGGLRPTLGPSQGCAAGTNTMSDSQTWQQFWQHACMHAAANGSIHALHLLAVLHE